MARVLLIDDDRILLLLLQRTLEIEHEVLTAADGQEGLDRVSATRPDLIVLDVMMPVLDGYRVLHRLKAQAETRSIPVVLLTVKDTAEEVMLGLEIGADYYLTKPVDPLTLAVLIRRHLARSTTGRTHTPDLEPE